MKRKRFVASVLAASVGTLLLMLLPYKHYTLLWLNGSYPVESTSAFDHIRSAFTDSPLDFTFLSIGAPVVLLVELHFSGRHSRIAKLFPIQAILLTCATMEMLFSMNFNFLETHVTHSSVYYLTLAWVAGCTGLSFALMSRPFRHRLERLLIDTV